MEQRTAIHDRVDLLRQGRDPYYVARLQTGWVTVCSRPLIHGHCVVYADPVFFSVNDMPEELRMKYWRDVCRVGDALIGVTGSYRINYETLCNVAQALHTHVIPRQKSESDDKRRERAAVAYAETDFDLESGRELISRLRSALQAPHLS